MDNTLSPEMQQQIRAYCEKVCAMHGLDDVREELQDHFEDKMLAYLSNREKLQEQDAFLLVREHLGDAAELKLMFQSVHTGETRATRARRLAAAAAATLALVISAHVVQTVTNFFLVITWGGEETAWLSRFAFAAVQSGTAILIPLALFRILRKWQSDEERGRTPWYVRFRGAQFILLFAGLVLLIPLVPRVAWSLDNVPPGFVSSPAPTPIFGLLLAITALSLISVILVWLWWCDRAPRMRRTQELTLVAWLGLHALEQIVPRLILPSIGLFITDQASIIKDMDSAIVSAVFPGSSTTMMLTYSHPSLVYTFFYGTTYQAFLSTFRTAVLPSYLYLLATALAALAAYRFTQKLKEKRAATG